jgi:hypothetical protein
MTVHTAHDVSEDDHERRQERWWRRVLWIFITGLILAGLEQLLAHVTVPPPPAPPPTPPPARFWHSDSGKTFATLKLISDGFGGGDLQVCKDVGASQTDAFELTMDHSESEKGQTVACCDVFCGNTHRPVGHARIAVTNTVLVRILFDDDPSAEQVLRFEPSR